MDAKRRRFSEIVQLQFTQTNFEKNSFLSNRSFEAESSYGYHFDVSAATGWLMVTHSISANTHLSSYSINASDKVNEIEFKTNFIIFSFGCKISTKIFSCCKKFCANRIK